MAIYRLGTASLAANGVVIGVGTKWQDKLSLIRVGATILFPKSPGAIGTISAIVSDTELRVMTTNGAVVPAGSDYIILLHDSITVEGLAQDVAETLRYYQSKETEIAGALDFFRTFDWEAFKVMVDKVAADTAAAEASKNAAKTSETNAKASETKAKTSETNAKTSETNASGSAVAAKTSETNAKASETAANASKNAAATSATAAKTSETNAKTSETNSKSSENAANGSKNAAAASATAAAGSEANAKTSETNAKASETAANGSKNAAATSATNAKTSETNSKASEVKAKEYADSINPSLLLAKGNNLSDVPDKATARDNLGLGGQNAVTFRNIELGSEGDPQPAFIDFHYDGSKGYDYSSRIICTGDDAEASGNGSISIISGKISFNMVGDATFNCPIKVVYDGSAAVLKARTTGAKVQLVFQNTSDSNYGWIGLDADGSDTIAINNSQTGSNLRLMSGRLETNSTFGAPRVVTDILEANNGSVYVKANSASNAHIWFQNADNNRNRAVVYSGTTQMLNLRSDNSSTGASGQSFSLNGATGECRAASFTNTSDERAKFWRKPVTDALNKICQINGETFSMHTTVQDTVRKSGLIAQDVQKILPEAVTVGVGITGVIDKDCREIFEPLALDYNAMSALYVEAIKELKSQVDELRAEIELLKSK